MEKVGRSHRGSVARMERSVMREFDIIESPLVPGLSVIEASAGTGKTHALSHLVPRLLLDGSADGVGRILLVTFTNDAARELSERVRKVLETLSAGPGKNEEETIGRLRSAFSTRLDEGVINKALFEIDQLRVSTIHSFCQQVLRTEGALCGLPVMPELLANTDAIVEEVLRDIWEGIVASDPALAALAAGQGWNYRDDLDFVLKHLSDYHATPLPDIGNFSEKLESLKMTSDKFTATDCKALRAVFHRVASWNKTAPEMSEIEGILDVLQQSTRIENMGFLSGVEKMAEAPSWINKRKCKALADEVQENAAVKAAIETSASIKDLQWPFRITLLRRVHDAVERRLGDNRQINYDGLISRLHQALSGANGDELVRRLRERYSAVLIDESQDTDPRQMAVFSRVFLGSKAHRMILIGDPKQAIYGFRGADVNTYLDAKADAKNTFGLNKTYRAPQGLVEAWNALFARPGSLLKDGLQCSVAASGRNGDARLVLDGREDASRMEFWIVPDDSAKDYSNGSKRAPQIAGQTASEIVRILKSGKILHDRDGRHEVKAVCPGDFAVLVSTGLEAAAIEAALKERHVPSVRAGVEDVMQSDEARDLLAIFRALDAPRRRGLRFAALATRLLGRTDAQLRKLPQNEDAMLADFLQWGEALSQHGPAAALALIDSEEGIVEALANGSDGDRRITNFRQLCDVLQAAYTEQGGRPGRFVRWLSSEVARAGRHADADERQMQLESDADAVRIVTMHKSKGLQYPLVFCPFLGSARNVNGVQKLSRRGQPDALVDTVRHSEENAMLARTALEERLRLAYVAVTRAQVRVWIHAGALCGSQTPASALDWLLRTDFLEAENFPLDAQKFGGWMAAAAQPGRGARHEAGVRALGAAGMVSLRMPPEPSDDTWSDARARASRELSAEPSPHIPEPWHLTSFSALTREENPHWDVGGGDDLTEATGVASETMAGAAPNPFLLAAGGKAVGTVIHDWMQGWDFGEPDAQAVKDHLSNHVLPKPEKTGMQALPLDESVVGMLAALRGAALPGFSCSMTEACAEVKASEWHFYLPIHDDVSFDAAAMARLFEAHPQEGFEEYPARLNELSTGGLRGFLHGFIDRIAVNPQSDEWGVIDWKTNRLGDRPEDYDAASLRRCAMNSHYFLQVHLYLVALRRHLGNAARAHDAWLVFLRGICAGTSHGILHIRPPANLLAALDNLFFKP